jgi:hypothetical protein
VNLVRDVLDNPILDARNERMGRVDGILAEVREGQPPRLVSIEVSGIALARRFHPKLGRWAVRLARRFSPTRGRPCRIPWSRIREIDRAIHVDAIGDTTTALAWERWLRRRVIGRIPGA